MVRVGAFELHLLVGGVKQAQLVTSGGVAYVESTFAVPGVSYKVASRETDGHEEFTQEWPVTPYTLRVVNHSADTAYCKVKVDGAEACSQYLHPGDNDVKGFKDSSGRRAARAGGAQPAAARAETRAEAPHPRPRRSAGFREFVFTPPRRVNLKRGENPEPQFNDEEKARAARRAAHGPSTPT